MLIVLNLSETEKKNQTSFFFEKTVTLLPKPDKVHKIKKLQINCVIRSYTKIPKNILRQKVAVH